VRRAALLAAALVLLAGCGGAATDDTRPVGLPGSAATGAPTVVTPSASAAPVRLDPCPGAPTVPARSGGLPDLTLRCLGTGPAVTLSALRGTPTVVNVWAAWCSPCQDEMPALQAFHRRAGAKVRMLGVDYKDERGDAVGLLREAGTTYASVADPGGRSLLGVRGLPVTLLVDADGRVVHRVYGSVRSPGNLSDLVRSYLGVTV
jgi:cytochrome c biogenesis protein CcmG, thiol:disulfide interchange protein DsbE